MTNFELRAPGVVICCLAAGAVPAKAIIVERHAAGSSGQAISSAAFGYPFEGEASGDRIVTVATAIAAAGPGEIALAQTIGAGNPADVKRLVAPVRAAIAPLTVREDFHTNRGTGIASLSAAVVAGASIIILPALMRSATS